MSPSSKGTRPMCVLVDWPTCNKNVSKLYLVRILAWLKHYSFSYSLSNNYAMCNITASMSDGPQIWIGTGETKEEAYINMFLDYMHKMHDKGVPL
jgi:hypothetical protein